MDTYKSVDLTNKGKEKAGLVFRRSLASGLAWSDAAHIARTSPTNAYRWSTTSFNEDDVRARRAGKGRPRSLSCAQEDAIVAEAREK